MVKKNWLVFIFPILIISAQNITIFFDHYFNKITFQSDFIWGYMAMPSLVFQSIQQGVFPHWTPFQGFGYPVLINLQMGVFFPVFIFFGIAGIAPTPFVLTVLQCLHILFGSIGMYVLARFYTKSSVLALLAALAFQFHGSFFSNSQHPDIIRSISYVPWLAYVMSFYREKKVYLRKIYWLPMIVFLLVSGGYPGIVISSGICMATFATIQLVRFYLDQGQVLTAAIRVTLQTLTLVAVASTLMTAIVVGPFLHMRQYLTRSEAQSIQGYSSLEVKDLVGLVLNNSFVRNDPSMYSLYLGLPILLGLLFLRKKTISQELPLVILGFLALLMSIGKHSPVWIGVSSLFPIMRMSRHPISDYRPFLIVSVLLLFVLALRAWFERDITPKNGATTDWRAIVLAMGMSAYFYWELQFIHALEKRYLIFFIGKSLLTFGCFILVAQHAVRKSIALIAIIVLTMVSGYTFVFTYEHVLSRSHIWKLDWYLFEEKGKQARSIGNKPFDIEKRPARTEVRKLKEGSVDGYYLNKYMIDDIGNTILKSRVTLLDTPEYYQYMVKEWTPLVLPCSDVNCAENNIGIERKFFTLPQSSDEYEITQVSYGLNTVSYRVRSSQPFSFVENEIFMPGWSGVVEGEKIEAQSVNSVLRAWSLPAGEYAFHTRYVTPYFKEYFILSLSGLGLWILTVIYSEWSRR